MYCSKASCIVRTVPRLLSLVLAAAKQASLREMQRAEHAASDIKTFTHASERPISSGPDPTDPDPAPLSIIRAPSAPASHTLSHAERLGCMAGVMNEVPADLASLL